MKNNYYYFTVALKEDLGSYLTKLRDEQHINIAAYLKDLIRKDMEAKENK